MITFIKNPQSLFFMVCFSKNNTFMDQHQTPNIKTKVSMCS